VLLDGSLNHDVQADSAFVEISQRTLIVWKRVASASSSFVRGVLLNPAGTPVSSTLSFASIAGTVERPRVATVNQAGRFLVVWNEDGITSRVHMQTVNPATGGLSALVNVDAGPIGTLHRADVGAEVFGSGYAQGMVVWDEDGVGIQGARVEGSRAASRRCSARSSSPRTWRSPRRTSVRRSRAGPGCSACTR
jgi:hypothetical protein